MFCGNVKMPMFFKAHNAIFHFQFSILFFLRLIIHNTLFLLYSKQYRKFFFCEYLRFDSNSYTGIKTIVKFNF